MFSVTGLEFAYSQVILSFGKIIISSNNGLIAINPQHNIKDNNLWKETVNSCKGMATRQVK